MRKDRRQSDQLREVKIHPDYIKHAMGSVLIEVGHTKVICTASVEYRVPPFLLGSDKGWITAEYGMLPMATAVRTAREASKGKPSGRTQEIQRLIGRSLRAVTDLKLLSEKTIWLDCDVIQADGGTRTASITGAFVALALCIKRLTLDREISAPPLRDFVAATSVGAIDTGEPVLDLDYSEDALAKVDMNIVMTGKGEFIEIQGTAEGEPFSEAKLNDLLALGRKGIRRLVEIQKQVLGERVDLSKVIQHV